MSLINLLVKKHSVLLILKIGTVNSHQKFVQACSIKLQAFCLYRMRAISTIKYFIFYFILKIRKQESICHAFVISPPKQTSTISMPKQNILGRARIFRRRTVQLRFFFLRRTVLRRKILEPSYGIHMNLTHLFREVAFFSRSARSYLFQFHIFSLFSYFSVP